jgi:UDP-N-acetylglucosamine--N-acetylmuramyl-(pentapeptide) pyrophosphoryl-undecaprenol N-acetylglucosamine transferase
VSHQAREEDITRVAEHYAGQGIDADVETFFHDVPRRMSEAQLVITRSGASTVADLTVIGRPSILVPLAASIRDEQTVNARGLVEAGAAILMPESQFSEESLAEQIALVLEDPAGAEQMARAALSLGKPEAAQTLADMVDGLAGKGKE